MKFHIEKNTVQETLIILSMVGKYVQNYIHDYIAMKAQNI